jgi:hypothetical protein
MELDIRIDSESMSINIENPYRFDVAQEMQGISDFGSKFGVDIASLQIEKLIPRMLKGVAGCEAELSYVEGGILTAIHKLGNGKSIEVKVFPDFD